MIIKIYRLLMAFLLIIALIGSFEIPRRDLRATGQVAGIALDKENGQIKATFELYVPAADEPIGKTRKVVVSTGESLEECIANARRVQGETLFVNDAAALVIGSADHSYLLEKAMDYFRLLKNDHMDLPVFFAFGQSAGAIFEGEGVVLSTGLAESAKSMDKLQTVKNLMNGIGERILIKGEGAYEIIS
ncbi:MAG: hypothetical protein IJ333_09180 [Clostridia bacterium]|nr:hypothetical protein [Clostridia bacterium]